MSDHYSILGLTKSATTVEIKTAYRRLVKIYHPDKNPNNYDAVERFRKIQEAYEILSDPIKKSKYDGKISYTEYYSQQTKQAKQTQSNSRAKKNYSFTEEDLKRRQFYKEQYKQQYSGNKQTNSAEEKKRYNETKYILMSIPLAIALLFFIINVYERSENKSEAPKVQTQKKASLVESKAEEKTIGTSDEPYKYFFGTPGIDRTTLQVIQVTNYSGQDAIVCLVNAETNKVTRHYFIANNFFLYFEYLPEGKYFFRNYIGNKFNPERTFMGTEVKGGFDNETQFQEIKSETFEIKKTKHDTMAFNVVQLKENQTKKIISATQFFVK